MSGQRFIYGDQPARRDIGIPLHRERRPGACHPCPGVRVVHERRHHGGKSGRIVGRRAGTTPRQHDLARTEDRERHDRHTKRQRFEQHQTLRLGARGEHEQVARGIAVLELAVAAQVTHELHRVRKTQFAHPATQMRDGGSFACQGEQHSRQPRSQLDQHVEQEVDVLLMGDATDVHQRRPIGRGGDRGRDTVHAREEHVRNHQDVHGGPPSFDGVQDCRAQMTAGLHLVDQPRPDHSAALVQRPASGIEVRSRPTCQRTP